MSRLAPVDIDARGGEGVIECSNEVFHDTRISLVGDGQQLIERVSAGSTAGTESPLPSYLPQSGRAQELLAIVSSW